MVIQPVSTYETASKSVFFTFAPVIPIAGAKVILKLQNQMKVLEEIKVSVYENVYSKKPKVMSFLEVIFMCIHPVYASIIQAIRRYHQEGDHEAAQKILFELDNRIKTGYSPASPLPALSTERMPSEISGCPVTLSDSTTTTFPTGWRSSVFALPTLIP